MLHPGLILAISLLAAPLRAQAPAAPAPPQLADLHALMKDRQTSLQKAIADLQRGQASQDATVKLGELLSNLPDETDRYQALKTGLGEADGDPGIGEIKAAVRSAQALQQPYWQDPKGPGALFPERLKIVNERLILFLASSEARFAAPNPQAPAGGASGQGVQSSPPPQTGPTQRAGASILECARAFDGDACRAAGEAGRQDDPSRTAAAQTPDGQVGAGAARNQAAAGARTPGTGRAGAATTAIGTAAAGTVRPAGTAAARGPAAAPTPETRGGIFSGGVPRIDQTQVPPAASPADQACERAVNGPDPARPQHATVAGMCHNHPTLAPMVAGLLDSIKESFGTLTGILMNVGFFLFGLVSSVLTGGVGLIIKLLGLIGMSWAMWKILSTLISAYGRFRSAEEGSAEKSSALRQIGVSCGSLLIMVMMVVGGYALGRTKPGAAAVQAMESGTKSLLVKTGIMGGVASINARIPAPVIAALEKVLGGTPKTENAPETAQPAPAAPAPKRAGGGTFRVGANGHNWDKASLKQAVSRLLGDGYEVKPNADGSKLLYISRAKDRQIVYDPEGNYFRVQDLTLTGRRTYLDIEGRETSQKLVPRGNGTSRQSGKSHDEYQRDTHFMNTDAPQ